MRHCVVMRKCDEKYWLRTDERTKEYTGITKTVLCRHQFNAVLHALKKFSTKLKPFAEFDKLYVVKMNEFL